jgi:hypothetical protein
MNAMWLRVTVLIAFLVGSEPLLAQQIRGVVRDSATGTPIAGAVVALLRADGATVARGLTDVDGTFSIGPAAAARRIRVLRIGFRPTEVLVGTQAMQIAMTKVSMVLDAVTVSASSCQRWTGRESAMAVYEHARAALLAMVLARSKRGSFVALRYDQTLEGTSDHIVRNVVRVDSTTRSSVSFSAALGAPDFVESGFGRQQADGFEFLAPDADILLDERFARGYCFHLAPPAPGRVGQIGLGFAAARPARDRVDIEGTLWVDTIGRTLRDIEFRYVGLDPFLERFRPGGRIAFEELSNGTMLITQWALRLVGTRIDTVREHRRGGRVENVERTGVVASIAGGELASAWWPDGTRYEGSLGRLLIQARNEDGPVAGARFRLVDTPIERASDSVGRAELAPLVPGPYEVVIIDSALKQLSLTIPTGVQFMAARDSVHSATISVPTLAEYVARRCTDSGRRPPVGSRYLLARVLTPYDEPVGDLDYLIEKRPINSESLEAPVAKGEIGTDGVIELCSPRLEPGSFITITITRRGQPPIVVSRTVTEEVTLMRIPHKP